MNELASTLKNRLEDLANELNQRWRSIPEFARMPEDVTLENAREEIHFFISLLETQSSETFLQSFRARAQERMQHDLELGPFLRAVSELENVIISQISDVEELRTLWKFFSQARSALEIENLEDRKRAVELRTVAEVVAATATILNPPELIKKVVDMTKVNFGLYHAQIYLVNLAGDMLELASGSGEVGAQLTSQGWKISTDRVASLVARAYRTRQGVIVNDVRSAPDFMPNPLLPDTRSELAVPIIVSNQVLGVLDVQSAVLNRFTDQDVIVMTTLAELVATVLQNARLFDEVQRSDKRYRRLLSSLRDGFAVFDVSSGRIIECNPTFEQITGYDLDKLEQMTFQDLTPPEWKVIEEEILEGKVKPEGYAFYEKECIHKDGHIFPIELAVYSIHHEHGNPTEYWGFIRDITGRKRAEEALRESESRYRYIFDTAAVAIWEEDFSEAKAAIDDLKAKGFLDFRRYFTEYPEFVEQAAKSIRVRDVNQQTLKMYGANSKEELLDSFDHIIVLETMQVISDELIAIAEGRRFYAGETINKTLQGERLNILLTMSLPEQASAYNSVLVSIMDITELKRVEEALRESEAKLRNFIEQSFDGIVLVDGQGIIVEWNQAAHEITGFAREEVIGHPLWELQYYLFTEAQRHRTNQEVVQTRALEAMQTGQADWLNKIIESPYERIDGTHRYVQQVSFPIKTEKGYWIGSVLRDNTEQKLIEIEREQLLVKVREQAQQVREIMNTVPEGVVLLDTRGLVLDTNPVAEGYLTQLAGAKVGEQLIRLGDRPLKKLLTSPPKGLWHEVKAAGRIFETIARPMSNGPEPEHWVLVVRDVTQERELQKSIQQQERLAALGQLAAGIAHDFNNTLAVILLYAEISLNSPHLPPDLHERMSTIVQQSKRASNLIQQILDFSRRAVLERKGLDLLPFLKEQIKLLERTLPENIIISLDSEPGEYLVNVDPTRIQQALTNLVVNARDAMPDGGNLDIRLSLSEQGKPFQCVTCGQIIEGVWGSVSISDTGRGISSEVLPHIFEPFFTTKPSGQGTGLGLSQVYGIIKQHEGHISVQSQVDKGSTFNLWLPLISTDRSQEAELEPSDLPLGLGQKILVVEDEPGTRQALIDGFSMLNYRVHAVSNGSEALIYLEEHTGDVDLILSDVVMPEIGGIALFHTLRERGLAIPVVLMTGHPLQEELEQLHGDGLVDWLNKPPTLHQLAEVASRALEKGR